MSDPLTRIESIARNAEANAGSCPPVRITVHRHDQSHICVSVESVDGHAHVGLGFRVSDLPCVPDDVIHGILQTAVDKLRQALAEASVRYNRKEG